MTRTQQHLNGLGHVRGFTLIELLVAIMIMTLLMTASMGAVRVASKSMSSGVARADATEEMRAVSDFLRRQFAQLPPTTIGEGKDKRIAFSAEQKQLRFVAPAPRYSNGAGLMTYSLAARTEDGREFLTLSYSPFDPGSDEFDEPLTSETVVLGSGFEAISFHYFGAEMEDDNRDWKQNWRDDAEQYPGAIRIRTRTDLGNGGWPDLVYTLRLGERS